MPMFLNHAFNFWKHKQSALNSDEPFLVLCKRKISPIKGKLNNKPIGVKRKALKDLGKRMTNKGVEA